MAVFNYAGAGALDAQLEAGRTPGKVGLADGFHMGAFTKKGDPHSFHCLSS